MISNSSVIPHLIGILSLASIIKIWCAKKFKSDANRNLKVVLILLCTYPVIFSFVLFGPFSDLTFQEVVNNIRHNLWPLLGFLILMVGLGTIDVTHHSEEKPDLSRPVISAKDRVSGWNANTVNKRLQDDA